MSNAGIILRLVTALVLGGLIGVERETHGRPAGFRTHILVCVGSALLMIVSAYGLAELTAGTDRGYDPGRIAAQVVSGIGFLGAGTILREGANVRGLTTAASLWTVAGIGLAVGAGLFIPAVVATGLVAATLVFLSQLEERFFVSDRDVLVIHMLDSPGQLGRVFAVLGDFGVNVTSVELASEKVGEVTVELAADIPTRVSRSELLQELTLVPGVMRAERAFGKDT